MLAEVLSSGNRKQLFMLTKNGKRFSRLVDGFFVSAPLLRMDIILWEDVRFNLHIYCHIIISICIKIDIIFISPFLKTNNQSDVIFIIFIRLAISYQDIPIDTHRATKT